MATKFAQFLQDNKIDPRRIVVASQELERLRPEDRKVKHQKRAAKKAGTKPAEGEKPAKPRSGRAVTRTGKYKLFPIIARVGYCG